MSEQDRRDGFKAAVIICASLIGVAVAIPLAYAFARWVQTASQFELFSTVTLILYFLGQTLTALVSRGPKTAEPKAISKVVMNPVPQRPAPAPEVEPQNNGYTPPEDRWALR